MEEKLFDAIKNKRLKAVDDIIDAEHEAMSEGKIPSIRYDAQDGEGNTFCHYAARTGRADIISRILFSEMGFVHHVQNNKGHLPEDWCWNDAFKKLLVTRKERDEKEIIETQKIHTYLLTVKDLKQQEEKVGGYFHVQFFSHLSKQERLSKRLPNK